MLKSMTKAFQKCVTYGGEYDLRHSYKPSKMRRRDVAKKVMRTIFLKTSLGERGIFRSGQKTNFSHVFLKASLNIPKVLYLHRM